MLEPWRAVLVTVAFGLFFMNVQFKNIIWPTLLACLSLFFGLVNITK